MRKTYLALILFACCMCVFACKDDDTAQQDPTESITYSSDDIALTGAELTIPVSAEGGSYEIKVTSSPGVTWEVKTALKGNFIEVTPSGIQEESGTITLVVPPNEEKQSRSTFVRLVNSLESDEKKLTFEQAAVASEGGEGPSFAVLSDLHYGRRTGSEHADVKTPRALKTLLEKQPDIKNVFVCGDMTDGGGESQYQGILDLCKQNLPEDVNVWFMLGNHEFYNSNAKTYFTEVFGQPIHQYIEIDGYPFITVSINDAWGNYDQEAVEFLRNNLEKAAEKYPGKPIFVFSHTPALEESAYSDWYTYNQLYETLSAYPQVVHFTGHLHFTVEDERSIKQNTYTWINVGPGYYGVVSDLDINLHGTDRKECYRDSGEEVTEGLIVNCNANTDVEIVRMDTKRNKEIKEPWVIKAPHDGSQFVYTDERTGGEAPVMSKEQFTITDITTNSCTVTIPQGTDDDLVTKYLVEFNNADGDQKTYKVYSEYFLREDMPATVSYNIGGLKDDTEYTVNVKAADSFENQSEAQTQTFRTLKREIDEDAKAPKADILDIMFDADGALNTVEQSPLDVAAGYNNKKPATAYNEEVKMYTSRYEGDQETYFKIPYSEDNFTNRIKDGFTYEVYCKTSEVNVSHDQCPFSGLEYGGIGLEMDPNTDQYKAMIHAGGGYKNILYSNVNTSRFYHYVFTYDGNQISAYEDGVLVQTLTVGSEFKASSKQWMCIGGDTSSNDFAQSLFLGEIAFCRIHDKAASSDEVYRLYEQVEKRKANTKIDELQKKLQTLSGDDAKEGWKLMNDIATTEEQITEFINKTSK